MAKKSFGGRVTWLGHATILASGPWIFAILSIGIVTAVTEPIAGAGALADFRVAIIYAFAASRGPIV